MKDILRCLWVVCLFNLAVSCSRHTPTEPAVEGTITAETGGSVATPLFRLRSEVEHNLMLLPSSGGGRQHTVLAGTQSTCGDDVLYVTNLRSNSISIIDLQTRMVCKELTGIASRPAQVVFTSDGSLALIASQTGGTVTFVDAVTHTVIPVAPNPNVPGASGVVISPDNLFAYVTQANNPGAVAVIDVVARQVAGSENIDVFPALIALSTSGSVAYVTHSTLNKLSILSVSGNSVSTTSIVDLVGTNGAIGVAVNPNDPNIAYVASFSGDITEIRNGNVFDTFSVGGSPFHIVTDPDGDSLFVSSQNTNEVFAVDIATRMFTPIPVGNMPQLMGWSEDGSRLYVACFNSGGPGSVSEIVRADVTGMQPSLSVGSGMGSVSVAFRPVPAMSQVQSLMSEVESLEVTGALSSGQSNSLNVKLQNVLNSLSGNTSSQAVALLSLAHNGNEAAIHRLGAFINEVNALVNAGILTREEGASLTRVAELVIHKLEVSLN